MTKLRGGPRDVSIGVLSRRPKRIGETEAFVNGCQACRGQQFNMVQSHLKRAARRPSGRTAVHRAAQADARNEVISFGMEHA
jgi:hypothetical protein